MNFKNLLKKTSGVLLATALAFVGIAGNVSASDSDTTPPKVEIPQNWKENNGIKQTEGDGTEFSFDNSYVPKITKIVEGENLTGGTFKFKVENISPAPNDYDGYIFRTSDVPLISVSEAGITLQPGENKGTLDLNVNQNALQAAKTGYYAYMIYEEIPTEDEEPVSGMDYDSTAYIMYLFVSNKYDAAGNMSKFIESVIVTKDYSKKSVDEEDPSHIFVDENASTTKQNLVFTNRLLQRDLTITKKITGNQADLEEKFDFKITVNTKNHSNVTYSFGESKNNKVQNGVPFTIKGVGHDSVITLTGLGSEDYIEITETDPKFSSKERTKAKYKATVESRRKSNGNTNVGLAIEYESDELDLSESHNEDMLVVTSKEELDPDGVTVNVVSLSDIVWTNEADAPIPAGLIENLAPFVLIIALAGGFAYFYFKKNRDEEQQYA